MVAALDQQEDMCRQMMERGAGLHMTSTVGDDAEGGGAAYDQHGRR